MVKTDLLRAMSAKLEGTTQKDCAVMLEAFEDVIVETLKADPDESIAFGKLGKFKVKTVPERRGTVMMGANKGSEYVVPQHDEITFKMSKTAKTI